MRLRDDVQEAGDAFLVQFIKDVVQKEEGFKVVAFL